MRHCKCCWSHSVCVGHLDAAPSVTAAMRRAIHYMSLVCISKDTCQQGCNLVQICIITTMPLILHPSPGHQPAPLQTLSVLLSLLWQPSHQFCDNISTWGGALLCHSCSNTHFCTIVAVQYLHGSSLLGVQLTTLVQCCLHSIISMAANFRVAHHCPPSM